MQLCGDAEEWGILNEQILTMTKKHGQLKMSTTRMVQEAMKYLDKTPSLEVKLELIETLRTVTEGKVFVEVERARVTKILVDIIENTQKDVKKAQETLCDLAVETFGSMDRREKTEYILEQVRLCISVGNYTLASIVSKKISTRYINDKSNLEETQDLKLKYYELMIRINLHADRYLEVCKNYRAVYDTPKIAEDRLAWRPVLQNIIFFALLAPHDNEQADLLQRISQDKNLKEMEWEGSLLKTFKTDELIRWPRVEEIYSAGLRSSGATFAKDNAKGQKRYDELKKRIIEHNVRVVAKYYTRIRTDRLAVLLDLSEKVNKKL